MKEKNNGITLISIIILIMIIIILVGIGAKYFECISERWDIFYKNFSKQIDIQQEIEINEKLMGITDVSGEGIIINIKDGNDLIHQEDLIILIDELKNSGSQAISINEQRITNSTYLYCDGAVILIDGVKIGNPFTIKAIGNSEVIYGALTRNKGYIETLKRDGLEITVEKSANVEISKTNRNIYEEYKNESNQIEKLYKSNQIVGKSVMIGRGARITIQENSAKLTALSFLQLINDLNSVGVDSISINRQRVTAMTDVMDINSKYVLLNSISIKAPFIIDVIGDVEKIEEMMEYENTYFSKIRSKKNIIEVERKNYVRIDKYTQKKDQNKMLINYLK